MSLRELTAMLPMWSLLTFVGWFGLIWGSFLNVVIYRVPRDMSVVRPASHCPGCGQPIHGYDNIPVLSYVILRGRARCCGTKMSARYPLVELIGGVISLAIFEAIILKLPGDTSVGRAAAIYGADLALCLGLISAAFIDAEHMILPDSITIGGTILGVGTASFRDLSLLESIEGGAIGFFMIWLPFGFLYKGLLGRTGMGLGDAKLVMLAGAWFGWRGAIFSLFAGALQGVVYFVALKTLGIETTLPEEVTKSLDELKKLAAEGDAEAIAELAADPLTEDEDDAFIVTFFQRVYRKLRNLPEPPPEPEPEELEGPPEAHEIEDLEERPRIPFGPFLIFACLELLLAHDWITSHLALLFFTGEAIE